MARGVTGCLALASLLSACAAPVPAPTPTPPPPQPALAATAPPPAVSAAPVPTPTVLPAPAGIPKADYDAAQGLSGKLIANAALQREDVQMAEDLHSRYASEPKLSDLLEAVLVASANQAKAQRRYIDAAVHLKRAAELRPLSARPWLALSQLLLEASDYAGAEAAARSALDLDPRDPEALEALGYALYRQDRNREAIEAFRAVLEIRESAAARSFLERLQKNQSDESGMSERRLSHFHVRYDGEEHEDVGREILRALDRHYATLKTAFDHEIPEPVAVILFTRQGYFDASGAPAWSGGAFDNTDGRIRIPVGGLTRDLTPYMDGTLAHELTHAFIHDIAKGNAPRELHEGLAQYMEGKRITSELEPQLLRALADGRIPGVMGFYWDALAFVEWLMASRGQGGMNELLRAMGETGDVNEGFRRVHGRDYSTARRDFRVRLKQQHGS